MSNSPGNDSAAQARATIDSLPLKGDHLEEPVGWLLGPQLIASLKWILLYSAFGSKLDPRDWMQAQPFPAGSKSEAENSWRERVQSQTGNQMREQSGDGKSLSAEQKKDFWEERGEFWFDYIADTGDGQKATYSIAYLCLNTLWAKKLWRAKPHAADSAVELDCKVKPEQTELIPLPRGEFLFVGGDTTYHMADYSSLHTRFQLPFAWAFSDYQDHMNKAGREFDQRRRLLFGIPGNHDYYDMVDGFRRQFCRPLKSEDINYQPDDKTAPQLMIPGYERRQQASYVALRLPFDWWLWGLDTEVGEIDERQRTFFKGLNGSKMPDKLIVATSAPTTVFGKYADEDDEKASRAFFQLGLPRLFLPDLSKREMENREVERTLCPRHQIRLDIAGDVHHYARYWGPDTPEESKDNDTPPRAHRKNAVAPGPARQNYASVVSGLGGAFHHPSTTYKNEVREQALYPPESESRRAIAREIFDPWRVRKGGYVWLLGLILATLIYLICTVVPSTREWINSLPLSWVKDTQKEQIKPTKAINDGASHQGSQAQHWRASPFSYTVGIIFALLAIFSLVLIGLTFVRCERLYKKLKKKEETEKKAYIFIGKFNKIIYPLVVFTIIVIVGSLFLLMGHRHHITPFGHSSLVLMSIVWAVAAVIMSFRYSDWLFDHAANAKIEGFSKVLPRLLLAAAVVIVILGLWLFGRYNQPAYLVADIVFLLIIFGFTLLLILLAICVGGEMLGRKGKALMLFIGLFHALLQLGVPFLLTRKGTWLTLALAAASVIAFKKLGEWVMSAGSARFLAALWFVYGGVILLLPYLTFLGLQKLGLRDSFWFWPSHPLDGVVGSGEFASYDWWGSYRSWWALAPAVLLAGVAGAAMSCVWFGWYLAVCLGFNGHNNEAGGAARIENYKEFIRFRLTKDSLTGYVIAVKVPQIDGQKLEPKIIDVFRLSFDKGRKAGSAQ